MEKFKKGDRVKLIDDGDDRYGPVKVGMTGVVDENGSVLPWVLWDSMPGDNRWAVDEDDLKLIPSNKFWIVASTSENNLTEQEAHNEAERLARENPGKKFYLIESNSYCAVDKPVIWHEL
jgi:hypothetical protein